MEKSTENPGRDTELLDISGELRGEDNYRNKNVAGISLQTFVKLGNQLISSRDCVYVEEREKDQLLQSLHVGKKSY